MPLLEKIGWVLVALGLIGWAIPRFVKLRSSLTGGKDSPDAIPSDPPQ